MRTKKVYIGFLLVWFSFLGWMLVGSVVVLTNDTIKEWLEYKDWPGHRPVTRISCICEIALWPKTLHDARSTEKKFETMNRKDVDL